MNQTLNRALDLLRFREPRMGCLLAGIDLLPDPTIKTACTNGVDIRYSPDFVDRIGMDDTMLVMIHEIVHIGLGHPSRMVGLDPETAQLAADHVVNNYMLDCGYGPPRNIGWVMDRKYRNWSFEDVYRDLFRQKQQQPKQPGQKPGQQPDDQMGQIAPPPSTPAGKAGQGQQAQQQIAQRVARSAASKLGQLTHGTSPARLEHDMPERQPYRFGLSEWLAQFMTRFDRIRPSFNPTHAQYAGQEILIPRMAGQKLGWIVIARDSSGSVPDEAYADSIAQTLDVIERYDPELIVVDCDAQVQQVSRSDVGDPPLVKRYGNGGTCFEPVFRWVEEQQLQPECLLYFTDAEGSYPDEPPPYPVAWIVYGNSARPGSRWRPPWGEIFEVMP